MTTVKNIYDYINKIAAFDTAEDWDNSGHLIGDFKKEVKKVVLSLDLTKDTALFSASCGADMMLTHHPAIFNPLKKIYSDSAIYTLVQNGISLISTHTNYDKAQGGINDSLAMLLNLKNTYTLQNGYVVCGRLEKAVDIDEFAKFVSDTLDCHALKYTHTSKLISSVTVGGGACGEFIKDAMAVSDCFVTSDIKYHEFLQASEDDFALISAGHYETECKAFLMIKERLEEIFSDVEFITAPQENPVLEV